MFYPLYLPALGRSRKSPLTVLFTLLTRARSTIKRSSTRAFPVSAQAAVRIIPCTEQFILTDKLRNPYEQVR